jgi:uncharacterized membrane protein
MTRTVSPQIAPQVVLDALPKARRVPLDAPWNWLAAGWRDLWSVPQVSLAYGAAFAFTALGLALGLWMVNAHALFLALAGGFMLVGPLVAVGLYEVSRRLTAKQPVSMSAVLVAPLAARGQLAFFGAILLFSFMAWLQLAFLLLMLFMSQGGLPPVDVFVQTLLFTPRGLGLLVAGSMVGFVLASIVFAMSAVAVPILLVKRIDAVTAMRASMAAVVANPKPMALWATLIVVMIAAGFATLLVGFVVAFPLIGHATWHAYTDIYGTEQERP